MHVNKNGEKSHRLIVGYQLASYNSVRMASSDDSKAHVRTAITHLHFYDCPLVSLSLATFYEELHGCFKLWKNTIRKKFSFKPQTARAQNKTVSRSGRFE